MTLTPTAIYESWCRRAKRGNLLLVKSLCELRELLSDCEHNGAMQLQHKKEFCKAYGYAMETLRDYIGKIREYSYEQLIYWIDSGVSFDHLEKANTHAEAKQMTPAQLLDFAVEEKMTVDEMVSFALGEKETPAHTVQAKRWFIKALGWLEKVSQRAGWDVKKQERYNEWIKEGWEFWE